ncbi:TPA_asm: hypothetical protein [ssRNA phage Esthiorhiza.3_1]|uniref:Uncharacterized protein n=2 Tax=Leviviricetes TaxID=2842243 RepID=A0A8S5KXR4_9VIRU|nr:hypothetical protein QIP18_gp3 [ssRNA phage Esthiorhiza.3_1]QDH87286.1 MAG: hypothetical protein H3RhizoLitter13207_000003 [Leviviridae sp.]DAD50169.1 TPA_asm: hypothetical protein [ssRNA phage Esthiorhiza.3_1]
MPSEDLRTFEGFLEFSGTITMVGLAILIGMVNRLLKKFKDDPSGTRPDEDEEP